MSLVNLRNGQREAAMVICGLQMRMLWSECFKRWVLSLLQYGKANRSGEDCRRKESLLHSQIPRAGDAWGAPGPPGGRGVKGKSGEEVLLGFP